MSSSIPFGSVSGLSPVARTINAKAYRWAAPRSRTTGSRSGPRYTGTPQAWQAASIASSAGWSDVATTNASARRLFATRSQRRCNNGFPCIGINALPGRRIEPIRTCTTMPARSLGMDLRHQCGSLVGDLLEGRGNVVHIGECRGRTYDSRQHQRFFVQPLGGGAEALVILGVSGVMTKRKRPSIVIERRKVQRTNIPGTQGDAFRLERLDKPITRHT